MQVNFRDSQISSSEHGWIKALLQNLAIGEGPGRWPDLPDSIEIVRRLTGGRSGAQVLEAIVKRGKNHRRVVIKLGPPFDLKNEFAAWNKFLNPSPNKLFVPIEVVSRRLVGEEAAEIHQEAVVYNHAGEYQVGEELQTFEDAAKSALASDESLANVESLIHRLFEGLRGGLYENWEQSEEPSPHRNAWNQALGFAATVQVNTVDADSRTLHCGPTLAGTKELYPLDVAGHALSQPPEKQTVLAQTDARMEWWSDDLLVAIIDSENLMLKIETGSDTPLPYLNGIREVKSGEIWKLGGPLSQWRTWTHRKKLTDALGEEFSLSRGKLSGVDTVVPDPFTRLADVIDYPRIGRVTSVVHGDLNPRNILLVDGQPCVIDYALTRDGQPLLGDFVRLEANLMVEAFASELSWAQMVRVQRLLALTCRMAHEMVSDDEVDCMVDEMAGVLAAGSSEMSRAFRLLWAIRAEARQAVPLEARSWWSEDYVEQLYLFGHQMLKWDLTKPSALAVSSILGVAAETFDPARVYELWPEDELKSCCCGLLEKMLPAARWMPADLASLGRRLRRWSVDDHASCWDAFLSVRRKLVQDRFAGAALEILDKLKEDHEVFISLKAYIDLKGQLHGVKARSPGKLSDDSPDELLEDDDLFAELEHLSLDDDSSGEDALKLIAEHHAVVLLGDAGAGKSTVARELEYLLARSLRTQVADVGDDDNHGHALEASAMATIVEPRLPIVVRASAIAAQLENWNHKDRHDTVNRLVHSLTPRTDQATETPNFAGQAGFLCEAGAVHVIVDALNELADVDKRRVAKWIEAFQGFCPLTPLVICHRQYNYPPDLLPLPIVTLQKVGQKQAERYIRRYLLSQLDDTSDTDVSPEALAERLIDLLLKSPDHEQVRDLAQTPLFLWMVVSRYAETRELPRNRAKLFDSFSQWYLTERHHQKYDETVTTQFDYEAKAILLGRLGEELVRRRATELPAAEFELRDGEKEVLDEIVTAELLQREGESEEAVLRFLHQSFQEYFAARHILPQLADNSDEIKRRIVEFGWHDTFVLLLGFGGEQPQVVEQVVEEALKVNPRLTARCLRMAEAADSSLLEQFVTTQSDLLADPDVDGWTAARSAEALAEYGRGQARKALWKIITNGTASIEARCQALRKLAELPGQTRFEPIAERLRAEFIENLPEVFAVETPHEVQTAAIDAIVKVKLAELGLQLADLLMHGAWHLQRAAWEACGKLELPLTSRLQDAYRDACYQQLDVVEAQLYEEVIRKEMRELNQERISILEQLASRENLPLLLDRRFAFIPVKRSGTLARTRRFAARANRLYGGFTWSESVADVIDHLVHEYKGISDAEETHGSTWAVLERVDDTGAERVDQLFELFLGEDEYPAMAAAHCLIGLRDKLPSDRVRSLLSEQLERATAHDTTGQEVSCELVTHRPWRLSALAQMVVVTEDLSLASPLDELVRNLIEHVPDQNAIEVIANLVTALLQLDKAHGTRLALVANWVVWTKLGNVRPQCFPWRLFQESIEPTASDYSAILVSGTDDARAAVQHLQSRGGGFTRDAKKNWSANLSDDAITALHDLAEKQTNKAAYLPFAKAAAKGSALIMIPWLVRIADDPEMAASTQRNFHSEYGLSEQCHLAYFLRSIGYLSRLSADKEEGQLVKSGIQALEQRRHWLDDGFDIDNNSIHISSIEGLATGLGYLGDWEPMLGLLRPGMLWRHNAARNIFKHWFPGPLSDRSAAGLEPDESLIHNIEDKPTSGAARERLRAAVWITRHLRENELHSEVRATLLEIKSGLEQKLGYHIPPDA